MRPRPASRGRRCFITGAASGIGRATALAAARRGAVLYLTDIAAAGERRRRDRARGRRRVGFPRAADIADHDAVVALAEEVHARPRQHGRGDERRRDLDLGRDRAPRPQHWQKTVDVNLMGPISVLECFVPPMIEAGRGGHVVNVSSAAGLLGLPWHAAYSAAKFGLRGVSEVLRFDLGRTGSGSAWSARAG